MTVAYFTFLDVDKGIATEFPSTKVAWATGNNVRITNGYVSKTLGRSLITTNPGSLAVRAAFAFVGTDGLLRTIVCCDNVVYAFNSDFTTYTDITPASAPTGGSANLWHFALVGGLPILCNGKDGIWKWASYAGVLTLLTGAPTWAKQISSCMNRLVVSNLTEGGLTYTGRVRWSETGNPENWTLDTTNKAGRHDIVSYNTGVEAFTDIRAQIERGHEMFFFAERGLWKTDFAAATRNFILVNPDIEILSSQALCTKDEKFYFIGKTDLYWSGGGDPTPFGLPVRTALFDNLNEDYIGRAFAFAPHSTREVWFCVATGDATTPNQAFVYNTETQSFSIADVDFSCHAETAFTSIPYDILGDPQGQILRLDDGFNNADGTAILGTIETGDLTFGLPDQMKRISDVIPELAVQDTVSELMVQVGVRNRLSDDIRWSDPVPFTIGVSDKCDLNGFRKEGKYVRIRFYSDIVDSPWQLSGYTIKYETGGTR